MTYETKGLIKLSFYLLVSYSQFPSSKLPNAQAKLRAEGTTLAQAGNRLQAA
jgi:hypothetical protein